MEGEGDCSNNASNVPSGPGSRDGRVSSCDGSFEIPVGNNPGQTRPISIQNWGLRVYNADRYLLSPPDENGQTDVPLRIINQIQVVDAMGLPEPISSPPPQTPPRPLPPASAFLDTSPVGTPTSSPAAEVKRRRPSTTPSEGSPSHKKHCSE